MSPTPAFDPDVTPITSVTPLAMQQAIASADEARRRAAAAMSASKVEVRAALHLLDQALVSVVAINSEMFAAQRAQAVERIRDARVLLRSFLRAEA